MKELLKTPESEAGRESSGAFRQSAFAGKYYNKLAELEKFSPMHYQVMPAKTHAVLKTAAALLIPAAVLSAAGAAVFICMSGYFEPAKAAVSAYGAAVTASAGLLLCSRFLKS